MSSLTRVLGLATAAYSAAIIVRPGVLAKPCGLTDARGDVPAPTRLLIGSLGARDLVCGLAMMFAPEGRPLDIVLAVRVFSDASDAVHFGLSLPDPQARKKAAAVAGGWATLCAVSHFIGRRR